MMSKTTTTSRCRGSCPFPSALVREEIQMCHRTLSALYREESLAVDYLSRKPPHLPCPYLNLAPRRALDPQLLSEIPNPGTSNEPSSLKSKHVRGDVFFLLLPYFEKKFRLASVLRGSHKMRRRKKAHAVNRALAKDLRGTEVQGSVQYPDPADSVGGRSSLPGRGEPKSRLRRDSLTMIANYCKQQDLLQPYTAHPYSIPPVCRAARKVRWKAGGPGPSN
jgi:hypothetical protein